MRRRRKKKISNESVELNLAAMLDMAFQLLTFFILTFKPMPVEGQVSLKLPPAERVVTKVSGQKAGADANNTNPVAGLESLVVTVLGNPDGNIAQIAIGEGVVGTLNVLDARLRDIVADPNGTFKQVVIQVGSNVRYEELMKVVDICTHQTFANGEKLGRLSFVELPDGRAR
jgi:biopolymer transport protein ExbD